jgi:imidazole glycerol-phosphate synthase subunit HisF
MSKIEKIRIIPKLEIKNQFLIKGLQFEGLRKIGNPIDFAKKYFLEEADQIIIQDIVASLYSRNNLFDIVKKISENIFIPITVGGGIRTLEDIDNLQNCGADRISINTKVMEDPSFIKEITKIYGSQFLTISIEIRNFNGKYFCMSNHGREKSKYLLTDWLKILDEFDIGEVMITSIDNDGSNDGYDKELIKEISKNNYNFPIVYGGGIGKNDDVNTLLENYDFSGVAIASSLHSNAINIPDLKKSLIKKGHNINII